LIGAYFDGHPWHQEVTIQTEDPLHPATRHLAPSFRITDEIYQFRSFSREKVHVLLRLDNSSVDLNAPGVNRADGYFANAWTRQYGSGRVFYTALGHRDEVWRDPRFRQHLLNGIRWAMGDVR
jgi:type 1 glutamine amidotransferase